MQTTSTDDELRFDQKLSELRKNSPLQKLLSSGEPKEDVFVLYLRGLKQEITWLDNEINKYSNVQLHFTNQYRVLEGHCEKIQMDLDKVDVILRSDLYVTRKELVIKIEDMMEILSQKVHPSGKSCPECDIKV